jgi:hypothetical protein
LLVGGDILQLRQVLHPLLNHRSPMVEFVGIGVGQRVLIFGLGQARAHRHILPRLHVELCALDLGHLMSQALNDLLCRYPALTQGA